VHVLLAAIADGATGAGLAVFTVLPFVALLVLRFALRVDVVTVRGRGFGSRSGFGRRGLGKSSGS